MWPFKRKAVVPLPPVPIPEIISPDAAVVWRIRAAFSELPDVWSHLSQYPPDTLLVHLEEVGTAAAAIAITEDNRINICFHTWLAHDRHRKKRHYDAPQGEDTLRHGDTTRVTLDTSFMEQEAGTVSISSNDGYVYAFPPTLLIGDPQTYGGRDDD